MSVERDGRERILREARTLFLQRGFAEVSMQQIADAVGMTKAALYYHFRNKDDLFIQVCLQEFRQVRRAVEGVIARHRSLEDRLAAIAQLWLDFWQGDLHRMMDDFRDHHTAMDREEERILEGEFFSELQEAQETLRRCFECTQPPVALRVPASLAALIYTHMLLSVGHQMHLPETVPATPEELVSSIIEIFLHGVVAPESAREVPRERMAARRAGRAGRQRGRRRARRRPAPEPT